MLEPNLSIPSRRALPGVLMAAWMWAGLPAAVEVPPCPLDKTAMTATGTTRQEAGRTLAEYRCQQGHVYWIAVD
ncbi:hypothetical protein AACH06_17555 [Ideonella sp. DXS29W]|uniref:Uncharacterized protein n=1 Tax=Ideonella lacteola TaxID=2984193 RepID=A0ABU9BVJ0_9BURK